MGTFHFENGIPWTLKDCYGYVSRDGQLHPQPEQAPIVKRIYQEFLAGERMVNIVTRLNEEGVLSLRGSAWTIGQIRRVLENINYTGNLLLQKTYIADPGKSVSKLNKGERDQSQTEQAPIGKRIYQEFLAGERMVDIVTRINEEGIRSIRGSAWTIGQIRRVLENINYTGNLLLQKTYIADPGKSVSKLNKGERDQYFVPDTHEALISMDDWQQVQKMLKSIPERKPDRTDDLFHGKVFCGQCGSTCWLHDESYIWRETIKGGRT